MSELRLTRRQIALASAWATPVLVVGAAAPAYAASGPCPTLPVTASGWTLTSTGSFNGTVGAGTSGYCTSWNNNPPFGPATFAFTSGLDNSSSTSTATVTTTATVAITAGVTYTIGTLSIGAGYGGGVASSSSGQSVTLSLNTPTGTQTVFSGNTRSGGGAGVTTLTNTAGNSSRQNYTPTSASYKATTSGTMTVVLTFVIQPLSAGVVYSDDISIALPTITCA